jgi:signal peptidase I
MGILTGLLYGGLAVYLVGWYAGAWTGNFSLLLFILTVVTLVYWILERFHFKPKRQRAAVALQAHSESRRAELTARGISRIDGDTDAARQQLLAQPWWLDWTAGLFPVILIVFVLRSFLFEPFKIPSGSMIPTLQVGDLILVNKYHYGIRLPVLQTKVIAINEPQRGDVVVFRYPQDTRLDYIKRVVGVPGDEVTYRNQQIYLNGKLIDTKPNGEYYDEDSLRYSPQYSEKLGAVEHLILVDRNRSSAIPGDESFPFKENCRYSSEGVSCKVPAGQYFMMGDNRDNSQDSRYWGFVPDKNIVGKAFLVWMNFGNLKRIGSFH